MSGAYTFETAAKLASVPVSVVEAYAGSGAIRVFRVQGQKCINADGLAFLQGVAKARAEALSGTGGVTAATRSAEDAAAPDNLEDLGKPETWSEDTIQAMGKKIADSLRGANPDPTMPQGIERITLRGGR